MRMRAGAPPASPVRSVVAWVRRAPRQFAIALLVAAVVVLMLFGRGAEKQATAPVARRTTKHGSEPPTVKEFSSSLVDGLSSVSDCPSYVATSDPGGRSAFKAGESYVPIEASEQRVPEQADFRHCVRPLLPLPDSASDETKSLYNSLAAYGDGKSAPADVSTVYTTACVPSDCPYVMDQLLALDVAVRHVVIVVNIHRGWYEYYARHAQHFPGRVTVLFHAEGMCISGSWNAGLQVGFALRPAPGNVMNVNADLWPMPGVMNQAIRFVDSRPTAAAGLFAGFSWFAVTTRGWQDLGAFDEVIFPGYGEDTEYWVRAESVGLTVDRIPQMKNADGTDKTMFTHIRGGSAGTTEFAVRNKRWSSADYLWRKWHVRVHHVDMAQRYKTPFNLPLNASNSWAIDPVHRRCILTGDGPKYTLWPSVRCFFYKLCDMCFYNMSALRPLLPEGTQIDRKLTHSQAYQAPL